MFKPYEVPGIIQGISQQSIQQRRDSQCADQENCINSPVDGVRDRPGTILSKFLPEQDFSDAFFYFIDRTAEEQYVVIVTDGDMRAFNLLSGAEANITFPDGKTYLEVGSGAVADAFAAVSIEDTTLIGNKTVSPALDNGDVSPASVNECLVYIRAGAYQMRYVVAIDYAGTKYRWILRTTSQASSPPDPDEAITTDFIATAFYEAMTGTNATAASGGIIGGVYSNVTASFIVVSDPSLPAGFNIALNANVIRIWRNDATAFTLDVSDGNGGNNITGIQGSVQAFSDLPTNCFTDVVVKVRGNKLDVDDDYYVKFEGSGESGSWVEVPKPGLVVGLDIETMPHQLRNTATDTFVFEEATWSKRVSGDGDKTSPTPSFVGKNITDLTYDNARFGILTKGSQVWSKANNAFTFFADTAKTKLADAPIDLNINYKRVSLLERFVQAGELSMVWARRVQFRIASTEQGFKEDTVSAKPAKNYEFSPKVAPLPVGDSLYFVTEQRNFAMIRDLLIRQERILGAAPVTAHVPRLIPKGVRHMVASDSLSMKFVGSEMKPNVLFNYAWLFGDNDERVQSAWNRWTFPSDSNIVWTALSETTLYLGVQRTDGFSIESMDLAFTGADPGETDYTTSLDMRCYGGASPGSGWVEVADLNYNAGTNSTTFRLPFEAPEAAVDPKLLQVVTRTATAEVTRGTIFEVTSVIGDVVAVKGDLTGLNFFVGWKIVKKQVLSEPVIKDDNGKIIMPRRLTIKEARLGYSDSAYFRTEVELDGGRIYKTEFEGKHPQSEPSAGVKLGTGVHVQGISQLATDFTMKIINDSPFPSSWTGLTWIYEIIDEALQK